jgi:hypothetical protein
MRRRVKQVDDHVNIASNADDPKWGTGWRGMVFGY